MRLGLGLNFLHRIISDGLGIAYLLLQNGDFLLQEGPIELLTEDDDNLILNDPIYLITEDGDNLNFIFGNIGIFTQDSKNISRQVGGFIMTQKFGEGYNAILEQPADGGNIYADQSETGDKIQLEHLA